MEKGNTAGRAPPPGGTRSHHQEERASARSARVGVAVWLQKNGMAAWAVVCGRLGEEWNSVAVTGSRCGADAGIVDLRRVGC